MKLKGGMFLVVAIQAWALAVPQSIACDVSLPAANSLPDFLKDSETHDWVGSPKLAAMVPKDGHWTGMGPKENYRDKWWWWREGYRAKDETQPELMILATRLDARAPPVVISKATNAYGENWDRILIGVEFPSAGCWDVYASYHGEELRFIFKVGD